MDNEFLDKDQLNAKNSAAEKKQRKKNAKKKEKKNKKPNAFVQILNGEFLTKEFMLNNLNFIFFLLLLLLLIVSKGYYGKQLSDDVTKTQEELNEITSEYFENKAKLEENTRRMVLVEELESSGLKETVNPTKVIRINKNNKAREQQ